MELKAGTNSDTGHTRVTTSSIEEINRELDTWFANGYSGACPVRDILTRVGDKWSVVVVLRLGRQPERFRALQRSIEGISQRMLTVTLRGLEQDGLVQRRVFDTRPPSVEYRLTPLGHSLVDHIGALANWAVDAKAQILAARAAFVEDQ